jgi:hypothetical protein
LLTWIFGWVALAGTLAGVTLPDRITLGDQTLVLNGLGLREFIFIDIYVAGLYLPKRTQQASQAIGLDVPKRLHLHFVREISAQDMRDSILKAIEKNPSIRDDVMPHIGPLNDAMEAMAPGDDVIFDYLPGQGTEIWVKGQRKSSVPGEAFMRGLWTLYLGDSPPTAALKKGLLGNQ